MVVKVISLALAVLVAGPVCGSLELSSQQSVTTFTFITNAPAGIVRSCRRENLSVKEGETDAAMGGVRVTPYVFTSISSSACSLSGYPKLELLNGKGRIVRRARRQHSDTTAEAVTIESGKTAWFNLYYNSGGTGHVGRPCPTYPKLRIIAPGITRPFVVRSQITSCARSEFDVSSIHPGMPD